MLGNSLVKKESTNITATGSLTLTNKTIDASLNTITNINTSSFTDILDIDLNSVSSNHDTIPSSKATKNYIDSQIPTGNSVIDWTAQYTSGSKIHSSNLPGLALTDIHSVNSESAHLSLSLEEGDIVIRTDLSQTYVHNGGTTDSMADFTLLQTPSDLVSSVNGQTGVINLTSTDIGLAPVDNNTIEINNDKLTVKDTSITNDKLAGSIANSKLVNDTISGISLGNNLNDLTVDNTSLQLNIGTTFNGSSNKTISVKSSGITNAMLAGSIENSKLINNSISIAGSSVALGESITADTIAGQIGNDQITNNQLVNDTISGISLGNNLNDLTVDNTSLQLNTGTTFNGSGARTISVKSSGITNAMLAGSIENSKLINNSISIAGSSVALGESITADTIAGQIGNDQITNNQLVNDTISGISLGSNLNDLTVDNTSLQLNTGTTFNGSSNKTISVKSSGITNAMLAGNIANSKLIYSSVEFGGVSLALGGSDATPAFDLSDAINYPTSSLTGTITNSQLAGTITNDKLAGSITNDKLAGSITNDKLAGSIDLTSKVTNVLPIANGGTGSNSAPMINIITSADSSAVKNILSLENVTNESKTTIFTNSALTGVPTAPTANSGTNTTQIATTAFVSSAINTATEGLHVLSACRVATTGNITLSGTQQIDGVNIIENNRVLVKDQSTGSENGIYLCKSGSWVRTDDFNDSSEIIAGDFVFVTEGTLNSSHGFVMITTGSITLGSTAITWTQFSGIGQVTAGEGIDINNHTISCEDASSSNKGIASFHTDNFSVSSGIVTIKNNGISNDELVNDTISGISLGSNLNDLTVDNTSLQLNTGTTFNGSGARTISVKSSGITNAMLAGSIENSKLSNSTISGISLGNNLNDLTVDNTSLQLNTGTTFNGSSNKTISVKSSGITNAMLAGSIENSKLSNSTISGISLGSNLNDLTVDNTSLQLNTGTTFNGSGARTISVKSSGITNAMLAGSIENSKLINSSISIAGSSVALGGSITANAIAGQIGNDQITNNQLVNDTISGISLGNNLNDLTVDNTSLQLNTGTTFNGSGARTISVKSSGITNAMLAGSIENSKLVNDTISGISLGSNLNDLTVDNTSLQLNTGTTFNGSGARTISVKNSGITNAMLAGSIANSKLVNDTISGISLGSNLNDLTVDNTSLQLNTGTTFNGSGARTISVKSSGITNAMLAGSIANSKLVNDTISGISLGSNLNDLTVDNTSLQLNTGTTFNGSGARTISVKSSGITNAMLAGSIENSKLVNDTISGKSLGTNLSNLDLYYGLEWYGSGSDYNGSAPSTLNIKLKSGGGLYVDNNGISVSSDVVQLNNIQTISNKTIKGGTIEGNLLPKTDITSDLGSSSKRFRDLYLSGSSIKMGNIIISENTSANQIEFKKSNGEHLNILSKGKNRSIIKTYSTNGWFSIGTTSWTFLDTDVRLVYTPQETGWYIIDCQHGNCWHNEPNWCYVGLSNTTSTSTPSIMNGTRQQIRYNGYSYHREQILTSFIVELTAGTTYNLSVAIKKYNTGTMRIYRGNGTSDGSPHAYIYVKGPVDPYVEAADDDYGV